MEPDLDLRTHLSSAIQALGVVKPEAEGVLLPLLEECLVYGPRAVGTKLRKQGEQLARAEKKALGLRANAFLTREVLELLTELGRKDPIRAIECTLGRASFDFYRHRSVSGGRKAGFDAFRVMGAHNECRGCSRYGNGEHHLHTGDEVLSGIPPSDCDREMCALAVNVHIDFLAGVK